MIADPAVMCRCHCTCCFRFCVTVPGSAPRAQSRLEVADDHGSHAGFGSHKVLYALVNSRTSSAYFSTTTHERCNLEKDSSDLEIGQGAAPQGQAQIRS